MIDANGKRITKHVASDGKTVDLDFGTMPLERKPEVDAIIADEQARAAGQVRWRVEWIPAAKEKPHA
jgi:hypothetical protein